VIPVPAEPRRARTPTIVCNPDASPRREVTVVYARFAFDIQLARRLAVAIRNERGQAQSPWNKIAAS